MPTQPAGSSEIARKSDEFLEYLQVERGASPLTLRNYRHYLKRFNSWLQKEGIRQTLADINQDVVRAYRVFLANMNLGRRTQGYHVIALRSFLKWLIKNDYSVMAPDKIDLPKTQERQVKFLTPLLSPQLVGGATKRFWKFYFQRGSVFLNW